ncbi:LamG domain-containing protein [Flavobacteriaceae bacterium F89]|uniref:LamG domain-containing protein n=1 Tax=Cerina litoralis TaxID=2874477 RepID=A0AAE3EUW0_9FLAO|nr:LamG-like jellyroll fold domain-containing protein [Cerina litoralis]MCG2460102.1 LamG domain-containing protein [Cerina litoralis]
MKNIRHLLMALIALALFTRCDQGIDPITPVDPGADASAPTVTMKYPLDGTKIKVNDKVVSIDIEFEATDDIEVANIKVTMDGTQIANLSNFMDYRRVLANIPYDNVTTGSHELNVTATDTDGKSTSSIVNFEKQPPYIPLFDNEIFYMAFDSDYTELISVTKPTVVGDPGFAGEGVNSDNSYAGASDSYLTFPTAGLNLGNELSAVFWYKVNPVPDRAGILVIGPKDEANPDAQNNRSSGFRLFRENAGGNQRIKLNVGNGTADTWVDGGAAADLNPASTEWVNIAFTISGTKAIVYINGQVVKESDFTGISWADCDILSIMSGAPRFTGWNHKSDLSYMDELRFFNKALTQAEIQNVIGVTNPYTPADGETLYMDFDEDYANMVSGANATQVGSPGFAGEAKKGANAYAGATDSYLTFPTTGLLGESFSATMWYKLNADPDRAGILVIGPPDPDNPDAMNNRTSGFRFFREKGADDNQRFKLNVGNGTADTWVDGGTAADVDPTTGDWIHLAFTISPTKAIVYINGEPVKESDITGIDWTGCDLLSIMSGVPRFTQWGHKSDLSYLDELHFYNKALTPEEIQASMAN